VTAAGHAAVGQAIQHAATNAFLHGLSIGCLVAGGVAAAGAVLAALFLPAQPASPAAEAHEPASQPASLVTPR
jgi:putative copper export protein